MNAFVQAMLDSMHVGDVVCIPGIGNHEYTVISVSDTRAVLEDTRDPAQTLIIRDLWDDLTEMRHAHENAVRPAVQAFIDRGSVELREVQHLNCTQEEAKGLVPVLTNASLARRIDRTLVNIMAIEIDPYYRALMAEAVVRLERM